MEPDVLTARRPRPLRRGAGRRWAGRGGTLSFGLLITWISCFMGFMARPTTEGVSQATTRAVVVASVSILVVDYILTSLLL